MILVYMNSAAVEAIWYLRNLGYAWLCDKGQRL